MTRFFVAVTASRLAALAGFLVIASAIGAARPGQTTALTITPARHDFGQVITGAQGSAFQFTITLPPGGGPGDAVAATVTGPDAGNFIVARMTNPLPTGTRAVNTCATAEWRTGNCTVGVEFIPQTSGVKNATLVVSDTRGNRGTATLTGTGVFGCTMYEGLCNYAANYSGNFGWKSTVNTRYVGFSAVATVDVDVTVKNGAVLCGGAQSESAESPERKIVTTGVISGPGLLVVEFKRSSGQFGYQITASCPSADITQTTTNYRPPETGTTTLAATPANWSRRESMDLKPASAIGIDLVGTQTGPHPEQDPSNGVTGTMTFTWSLKRP